MNETTVSGAACGSADHDGFVQWYGAHACGLTRDGVPTSWYSVVA